MTKSGPPSILPEEDYEFIEAAVMETARGRWFLAEFAQRNRNADTMVLLNAIDKLESALLNRGNNSVNAAGDIPAPLRSELMEMAQAIARTKREIAAMHSENADDSQIISATEELDAIVEATETATSAILTTAEQVQEIAWTMRESGVDAQTCDALDRFATDIYTACSFQDLTGQRTGKVIKVLRFLEKRVNAMIDIWGFEDDDQGLSEEFRDSRPDSHLLNGPALAGRGSSQEEVDVMMGGSQAPSMASDLPQGDDTQSFAPEAQAQTTANGPETASGEGGSEASGSGMDDLTGLAANPDTGNYGGLDHDVSLSGQLPAFTSSPAPVSEPLGEDLAEIDPAQDSEAHERAYASEAGGAYEGRAAADPFAPIDLVDAPDAPTATPPDAIDPRLAADLDAIGVGHDFKADIAGDGGDMDFGLPHAATQDTGTGIAADSQTPPGGMAASEPDLHEPDLQEPGYPQAGLSGFDAPQEDLADTQMPAPHAEDMWATDAQDIPPSLDMPSLDMDGVPPAPQNGGAQTYGGTLEPEQDCGPADQYDDGADSLAELAAAIEERIGAYASKNAMAYQDSQTDIFAYEPAGGPEISVDDTSPDTLSAQPDSDVEWTGPASHTSGRDAAEWHEDARREEITWSSSQFGHRQNPGLHPGMGADMDMDATPGAGQTETGAGQHHMRAHAHDKSHGGPEESLSSMLARLREVHKMAMFS